MKVPAPGGQVQTVRGYCWCPISINKQSFLSADIARTDFAVSVNRVAESAHERINNLRDMLTLGT